MFTDNNVQSTFTEFHYCQYGIYTIQRLFIPESDETFDVHVSIEDSVYT